MARGPIYENTVCGVCRQSVELATLDGSAAFFEPRTHGILPHRCSDEALMRWRVMLRLAGRIDRRVREVLAKNGDVPRKV